ncbi:unnamed protein product [Hermetia illucens]|uniref:Uncharacterized protein n=1 Tax=Hermetia illucens TaxID=343691 RepID=A0A7R8YNA0_HERIL|nr:unnamed protein product [Hermetia illucens]
MFPFKTCCLCCQLETGAYTLGILGSLGSLGTILFGLIILGHIFQQIPFLLILPVILILFASNALSCFLLMIFGAKTRNKWLLLPYIVFAIIILVTDILIMLTISLLHGKVDANDLELLGISIFCLLLGIHCVLSYRNIVSYVLQL